MAYGFSMLPSVIGCIAILGGQIMIWWSTVFARILVAVLAIVFKQYVDKKEMTM